MTAVPAPKSSPVLEAGATAHPWSAAIVAWCVWMRAAGYSAATIRTQRTRLRLLAGRYPNRSPWALTTADLGVWLARDDLALETKRGYRSACVTFYRWALEVGLTDHDPARNLSRLPEGPPRPKPVRDADYAAALALAPTSREALMLRLAAELGLRRGEVSRVHVRDLLADDDGWSLLVHGKGNRDRTVPLPDSLAEAISSTAGGGWLFPNRSGGHLAAGTVGALVAALLPASCSMHALRHRFATRAYDLEHNVLAVQELLGHANANTTRRYVLTTHGAMRRTLQALEAGR